MEYLQLIKDFFLSLGDASLWHGMSDSFVAFFQQSYHGFTNNIGAYEQAAIFLSVKVAVISTVITMPIALFLAIILAKCRFPGITILDAIIHTPLVVPPVVVGYGLLMLAGRNSAFGAMVEEYFGITLAYNWYGVALAAAIMALPLMVRAMRVSIEQLDESLNEVAITLGANKIKIFMTLTLPLIMPGIISGAILGFARALGEFGATITFVSNIPEQTQTLPLALYNLIQTPGAEEGAFWLGLMAFLIAFTAIILSEFLLRRVRKKMRKND